MTAVVRHAQPSCFLCVTHYFILGVPSSARNELGLFCLYRAILKLSAVSDSALMANGWRRLQTITQ